ncbi:MAG TPA: 5-oxoprolinase subunit PxpB [Chitinophagaceae bacterium]|jgi:inhibitor of KinA|nr:5-oxoprolinase subunit PxpB [Chitinophagaceae bacterium]
MTEYSIYPIGDSAITIDFGNYISEAFNKKVMAMKLWFHKNPFDGLLDVIIAYSSLSVIYDPARVRTIYKPSTTVFEFIRQKLVQASEEASITERDRIVKRIPVCYDLAFGFDLEFIAAQRNTTIEEIVELHTSFNYRVYMIGFQPGFPYMASISERIFIQRKDTPRQVVPAGSVGLAGIQTGIYPLDSQGGWQIIGRTPIRLFDKSRPERLVLKPGDVVRFYPVNMKEFNRLSD